MAFSTRVPFSSPAKEGAVQEIAQGDFNGDGILDLIIARQLFPVENRGVEIQVLVGNGIGGFSDQTTAIFAGSVPKVVHPREILVSDFNGDGRADIFIADHGYDVDPFPGAQNRLILSEGAGKLRDATANLPQNSDFTHSASTADIDGDGDLDLLSVNIFGQTKANPTLLLNDGTGRFTPSTNSLPESTQKVGVGGATFTTGLLADLNNDGKADLLLGSAETNRAPTQVFLNSGSGNFANTTPLALPTPNLRPSSTLNGGTGTPTALDVQTLNLNGDALPDLVVVYTNGNYTAAYIQLLINNGDGSFKDETGTRLPQDLNNSDPWVKYVHLVDVNSDGHVDILTEPFGGNSAVYLNSGTGQYTRSETLAGTAALEPLDIDLDGDVDLVGWNGGGNPTFSTYRNGVGTGAAEVRATELADMLRGGNGGDLLIGLGGADRLDGRSGNDFLNPGKGNDTVDGGQGTDTVILSGARSAYTFKIQSNGVMIAGPDGSDLINKVEQFQFGSGETVSLTTLLAPSNINGSSAVFRFFNTQTGVHFYSASESEALNVMANLDSFQFEGPVFKTATTADSGQIDVFRFLNTKTGAHFYTSSASERDQIRAAQPNFNYEGVAYKAYAADAGPQEEVYRFFNRATGTHFYTVSESERDAISSSMPNFQYEGIAFWALL